jgi:hypothetical protein
MQETIHKLILDLMNKNHSSLSGRNKKGRRKRISQKERKFPKVIKNKKK